MNPKISIIILNWNSWEDTIECLKSISQIDYPNYNVILIDNDSKDDSVKRIREYFKVDKNTDSINAKRETHVKFLEYSEDELQSLKLNSNETAFSVVRELFLIKNNKNHGFTKGNNIGINFALKNLDAKYILLLNNDTVVDKSFLSELVNVAKTNPKIGFVGPKTYYYNYDGKHKNVIQFAGAKQNIWKFKPEHIGSNSLDTGQFNKNIDIEYIHGSCMLVNVKMIKEIGLLDEEFFSYREENDWCIRGYKKGWKSIFSYKSIIWHKGGKSTKKRPSMLISKYYLTRNRFLFIKKHATKRETISFLLYFFLHDFWFETAVIFLYKKDLEWTKCYLKSVKDGLTILFNK